MIILDRYEGDFAVIEIDGKCQNISKKMLADGIAEGSTLRLENGRYVLDEAMTKARRDKLAELQDSLFL